MSLFDDEGDVRRVTLTRLGIEVSKSVATIGRVAVEGEVHKPQRGASGAVFFTLRDRAAQMRVRCPAARAARCRAVEGERVCVTGRLEWANDWGQLSLVAEEVVPVGAGAIAAAVAEARQRLAADGILTRPRRRLPRLPAAVGVVCGSDAAVRADILSVVADRFDGYPVVFAECAVSGPGAALSVIDALRSLDRRPEVEVIVIARGGGDAVQLLTFSDEELCRAIAGAGTPVVTAIGHEGDRPLCDEVADRRFGTPSIAAAAVIPSRLELDAQLAAVRAVLDSRVDDALAAAARRLAAVDREGAVVAGAGVARSRLDRAAARLELLHPSRRLRDAAAGLEAHRRRLEALSPVRVLERGYAIVRDGSGAVVRAAATLEPGDAVSVELATGRLGARVEEVTP